MIRKAVESDIPHIIDLIEKHPETLLPRSHSDYRELLDFTWVADLNGIIAGSCVLEIYSPKIAEIRSFVVDEGYRGKGVGKALISAAVAEAENRKIREIMVVTSAREYFEKLNFGACLHEKYALFWNGK